MHKIKNIKQELSFIYYSFKKSILVNRRYFLIGVLMVLCAGFSQVSLPYFLGRLIDVLSGKNTETSIHLCFCMLFMIFFLNTLFK